jgi:NAD(P)-dependent dehydrogenase (short-subunit alcohol dehydrogenase family)
MKYSFDDLKGKVCVLTGGAGVIGASMARALASVGIKTAIVDLNQEAAEKMAAEIQKEFNVTTIGVGASVLDKQSLEAAKKIINEKLGKINILINGAGGNSPAAK